MRLQAITVPPSREGNEEAVQRFDPDQKYASRKEHGESRSGRMHEVMNQAQVQIGMRMRVKCLCAQSRLWR